MLVNARVIQVYRQEGIIFDKFFRKMQTNGGKDTFVPGSDADSEEIFQYPFTVEDDTVDYLRKHGRIMFIIRGPAGTGKESLAAMLSSEERYPGAVVCSADSFFGNTFSSKKRDHNTLRQSHDYCRKRVHDSCSKGIHPIIVKNTHFKKSELQNYLNLAAEFSYTVIIASTMNKFDVSPEILAKSNTKGLSVQYFVNRLKQWQDILPTIVGWFLCPRDSSYLLNILQSSLPALLGDGKFCRVFNIFENDKVLEYYKAKSHLFSIAACTKRNNCFDLQNYYKSEVVREHYGQCFTLIIQGFLVSQSHISAIVYLDKVMQQLHKKDEFMPKKSESASIEDVLDFNSLQISSNLNENFLKYCKTCPFDKKFSTSGKTITLEKWKDDEGIDVNSCSNILLGEVKGAESILPWNVKMNFHKMLHSVANSKGFISIDQLGLFDDGYRYCRLPGNAWILRHPFKITLKSVFTGMYV